MRGKRTLKSFRIGALPLINGYINDCGLADVFDQLVPSGSAMKTPRSRTLLFLLRNIMLSSFPLYKLAEWSGDYPPELLGLEPEDLHSLNDDRIGRSLDEFFLADRSTMTTMIALAVIRKYQIEIASCHNDSTTVTFHGRYHRRAKFNKRPVALRRGFNKDHRPDLKQLVFNLVVCADGAVPIHCKLHDGNVTDDITHRGTWDSLRALVGHPHFIYVADSKLCTTENMGHIAGQGGKFITVMPKTRKEYRAFIQWIEENPVDGQALWYRDRLGCNGKTPDHYRGYECDDFVSQESYRIIWIRSRQKQKLDAEKRRGQIQNVQQRLHELSGKLNRYSLKNKKAIRACKDQILDEHKMQDCFTCGIKAVRKRSRKKVTRGRPGSNTVYKLISKTHYQLLWSVNHRTIKKKANADGFFPLITNIRELAMKNILKHYKYQPYLEKRHAYLKSVLEVAPMYLKTPERIEALLFLYYLALMIYALIERDMQQAMKKAVVKSIPIYPEQRECRHPSAERILEALQKVSKHELWENETLEDKFFDPLSDIQMRILKLLRIPLMYYQKM